MPHEYPEEQMESFASSGITPGEGQDAQEITVDGYTYPTNEYGHAIRWEKGWVRDGEWTALTTDPYEHISYGASIPIEPGDDWNTDLICFDYLVLEAHVALEGTIDCESGSFIEDFGYEIARHEDAAQAAQSMVDMAVSWFYDNYPDRNIEEEVDFDRLEDFVSDVTRDAQAAIRKRRE